MNRSSIQNQHSSIPKGILKSELFQPELLKNLDDDSIDVALQSVQKFVRRDTFGFILEVALERRGCLEFLLSCKLQNFSYATQSHLAILC
jgi:hypothetical protein